MERKSKTSTTKEFTWNGCCIVLMSFSIVLLWGGTYKCLGVLLPTLTTQFATYTWLIGTTVSLMALSSDIGGLFTKLLEEKFGTRWILIFTTSVAGVGVMLIPLATSLIHIAVLLTFVVGPSLGVACVINKSVLGRHFSRRYTLACGISHSGQAVALLAFAPLMQFFLDTYGWRGATLLLGAVFMHPLVTAALVRANKPQYQAPPDQSDYTDSNAGKASSAKALCARLFKTVDSKVLGNFSFWIVYCCTCGIRFVYGAWTVFYVPHLQVKGFSPQVSAALCTAAGVGYFFGTFSFAPLVDRALVKCSTAVILSSLTLALSTIVDPWVNNIPGMAVITVIYGLSVSTMYTLNDVLTKELLGRDRLTSAFGWIGALGAIPSVLAGFLPGWIYDSTGSYDVTFIVIGLTPIAALLPLVTRKLCKGI